MHTIRRPLWPISLLAKFRMFLFTSHHTHPLLLCWKFTPHHLTYSSIYLSVYLTLYLSIRLPLTPFIAPWYVQWSVYLSSNAFDLDGNSALRNSNARFLFSIRGHILQIVFFAALWKYIDWEQMLSEWNLTNFPLEFCHQ